MEEPFTIMFHEFDLLLYLKSVCDSIDFEDCDGARRLIRLLTTHEDQPKVRLFSCRSESGNGGYGSHYSNPLSGSNDCGSLCARAVCRPGCIPSQAPTHREVSSFPAIV